MSAAVAPLVVLDCGRGLAAGYAATLLAREASEVVRVVFHGVDTARRDDDPALRAYLDEQKAVVDIDPATGEGRAAFEALVRRADVLVEDFRLSEHASYGLEFEPLSALAPRLIVASISAFGRTEPYGDFRGGDAVAAFASGLAYLTPRDIEQHGDGSDQPPLKMPASLVAFYCGISAAGAILAALRLRERTAHGQHVDLSMVETLVPTLRREIALWAYEGVRASRFMRVWKLAPYGVKPCRDGYVFLQVVEKHHWTGLVDMMGNPEWARDPRYFENDYRFENRHDIEERMLPWLAEHTKSEIAWEAQRRSVPFAAVNTLRDITAIAQLHDRHFFSAVSGPDFAPRLTVRRPYKMVAGGPMGVHVR